MDYENQGEHESKIGCAGETLRNWVRQAERDYPAWPDERRERAARSPTRAALSWERIQTFSRATNNLRLTVDAHERRGMQKKQAAIHHLQGPCTPAARPSSKGGVAIAAEVLLDIYRGSERLR
jgi:hypothetical protein